MSQFLDIREDVSLRKFNTFHIEVIARLFTEINKREQFNELIESGMLSENQLILLGGEAICFLPAT